METQLTQKVTIEVHEQVKATRYRLNGFDLVAVEPFQPFDNLPELFFRTRTGWCGVMEYEDHQAETGIAVGVEQFLQDYPQLKILFEDSKAEPDDTPAEFYIDGVRQ
jgi:hypothetical protein